MTDFALPDCPEFYDWQVFETDLLRREFAGILEKLVWLYEKRGEYEHAIGYARRWLMLDTVYEPVHRKLMTLYALAGQYVAAARQFDECVRILQEEVGAPPSKETVELYEAIRTRRIPNKVTEQQSDKRTEEIPIAPSTRHNLPSPPTSFIGRENEQTAICQLLLEEVDCRLLTLIGPGGIGKTRLALEVSKGLVDAFPDGVYFVGLASVNSLEYIRSTIAEALPISFQGSDEPEIQLINYLCTKRLLLVADNLEHLLDGAELFSKLVLGTTELKIMVTSREALGLQEEWLYSVGGMSLPASPPISLLTTEETLSEIENNGAIQLFVQRARHANAGFTLSEQNMQPVVRICQLVDGMPLGIELAAAWGCTMSYQEIADEIEKGIDILSTSLRNVSERHRSVRAAIATSWHYLSVEQQEQFAKLSVSLLSGKRKEMR